jgi:hypothetical protein
MSTHLILTPRIRHDEYNRLVAMLSSREDPIIMVGWDRCILQGICRESGGGRDFIVRFMRPNLSYETMFVHVGD